MAFDLFEDQAEDVEALRQILKSHRSVVYQLATGGGKTVVAGHIAQSARRKGRKILILVHRRELVHQFLNTLKQSGLNEDVGIVCPGYAPAPWAPIQLAMVFSWCRRQPPFQPDLIFVDEAHHVKAKSWQTVMDWYDRAKVVGMTATPIRLDGKGLSPPFQSMHCGLSIPELIRRHRLSPVRVLRVPVGFGLKGVKKTAGEYNKQDLDQRANATVVGHSTNAYLKHLKGCRTIMFGVTKRHARETANSLQACGILAAAVGDDTPSDVRAKTFERFAEGLLDVVCNVSLIDEGFDVPACDAVMDVSHTASVTRYLQRVGRALRYVAGKEAILLDLVGNTYRHDLPDTERHWSLTVDKSDGSFDSAAKAGRQLRCCQQCLTLFQPRLSECPHCGAIHDGRPVSEVDVELMEALPAEKKPKAEPKMTRRTRANMLREAGRLNRRGYQRQAWKIIYDAGKLAGYHPNWAHISADLVGIPHEQRR